jgi:hypothetical protein
MGRSDFADAVKGDLAKKEAAAAAGLSPKAEVSSSG